MRIVFACILLLPLFAADTLIMRDGSRLDGTFVTGTSRTLTFVDHTGARRNFDLRDVREIQFATGTTPTDVTTGTRTDDERRQLLTRVRDDVRAAMDRVTLTNYQRTRVRADLQVLDRAIDEAREGANVSTREVRDALESIRQLSSVFAEQDRVAIRDNIRDVRQARPEYNVTGTRSRRR